MQNLQSLNEIPFLVKSEKSFLVKSLLNAQIESFFLNIMGWSNGLVRITVFIIGKKNLVEGKRKHFFK